MSATSGFGHFDAAAESWSSYLDRFDFYLLSRGINTENKKCATLLTEIGRENYSRIESIVFPRKPKDLSYTELLDLLNDRFAPKTITVAERFKFHKTVQAPGQSCKEYLDQLRAAAKYCKYDAFLEEALRDQLVFGAFSKKVQEKLLVEPDLTLAKARQILEMEEAVRKESTQMANRGLPDEVQELDWVRSQEDSRGSTSSPTQQSRTHCSRRDAPRYRYVSRSRRDSTPSPPRASRGPRDTARYASSAELTRKRQPQPC